MITSDRLTSLGPSWGCEAIYNRQMIAPIYLSSNTPTFVEGS